MEARLSSAKENIEELKAKQFTYRDFAEYMELELKADELVDTLQEIINEDEDSEFSDLSHKCKEAIKNFKDK